MFEKYKEVDGFTAFPNSNGKYFLNIEGKIMLADGTLVECNTDKDGYKQIFADLWDGVRFYRLKDLMAICFKSIRLPVSLWNEVDGFHIDNNANNLHASNIGYRFKSGPLECTNRPGFYYIPMFTRYGINSKGEMVNSTGNINKTWYVTKYSEKGNIQGGYYVSRMVVDVGEHTIISRHRSLWLAFKPYPNNVDKLVVNHINGVPGSDSLDNLELVTRSHNNTHAYTNNLKTQHKRVLVRDVLSGETTEHYSIAEAARQLGYPADETIRYRLISGEFSKVWEDGTQCKFKDDKRDWIIPKDAEVAVREASNTRGVRVRDCRSGHEKVYSSISEAGRDIGINTATIRWQLDNSLTKPHRGYQFKELTDTSPWAEFTQEDLASRDKIAKTVIGRNLISGDVCEYSSIRACARGQGNPRQLGDGMVCGKQRVYPGGWQYRFDNEDWREVIDLEAEMAEGVVEIMARNVNTGQTYIAESARKMADVLGLDSKMTSKAARTGPEKVYKLHQFRLGVSGKDWPVISKGDIELLNRGIPPNGEYFKFTHNETGEVKYFLTVKSCLDFLSSINSKPVFFRQIKKGKLLDGVWSVTKYRPMCLLNN